MAYIEQTDDVEQDITNIIQGINAIGDGLNALTALNIVAYGQIGTTVQPAAGDYTASFRHGLGYPPLFIVKEQNSGTAANPVYTELGPSADYYYTSPASKASGTYFYSYDFAWVDSQFLYVTYRQVQNSPSFQPSGFYDGPFAQNWGYILFSRPVNQV